MRTIGKHDLLKNSRRTIIFVLAAIILSGVFGIGMSEALDLGDILKELGKTYVAGAVTENVLAEPADKLLNTVLRQNRLETSMATKVVPIVSVGQGTRTGMAQVTGPRDRISQVRAVFEGEFSSGSRIRGRILIPINTPNPFGGMKRVDGVGVSAVFDYRL